MAVTTFEQLRKREIPSFKELRTPEIEERFSRDMNDLLSGERKLDSFLEPDDRDDFEKIYGNGDRDELTNSLYLAKKYKEDPQMINDSLAEIARQKWGDEKLSQAEIRRRLSEEYDEQLRQSLKTEFQPISLFGQAFMQSLAEKPAMALRGYQIFTPGEALGFDGLLQQASDYLEELRDKETKLKVEIAKEGRLWPTYKDTAWHKVKPELLPEAINTWSAIVGDQVVLMLMTWTGRAIGKVIGPPIGAVAGGAYALATAGPDPHDVAAAPVVAKATAKIIEHLLGASGLVGVEAAGFMDRANALGIDKDIAEKYGRPYALGSGTIEYAQWIWNLKAFKRVISPKVQRSILKRVLLEIGGATWEGIEELSQGGLEDWLIGKAIKEMKERHPEYDEPTPEILDYTKRRREFAIGLGVSLITRMPGHAYTSIRKTRMVDQIQKQTDATKEEAKVAVEAMAKGGDAAERTKKVVQEQIKQHAERVEKPSVVPVEPITPVKPPPLTPEAKITPEKPIEVKPKVEIKPPEIAPYQAEIGRRVGLKPTETARLLTTAEERYRLIKGKETAKRTTAEKAELAFLSRYRTDVEALVDQITMPIEERVFDRPAVEGLTRAEIGHLGRKEQVALRVAQAKGLPVGYKKGVAEMVVTARESLNAFRMKEKLSEKTRMDAANIVLTYVPKEKQGDYIRRILEAKTQIRIKRLTETIDTYLDKAEKRQAIGDFKTFVKDIKRKYRRGEVVLGKLPKKVADKIIDELHKFDVAKITEKKKETLESRAEFVTRISSELADGFEALNEGMDKDAINLLIMGTRRIDELNRLSQTYIGELDTDQIKYIQTSLEHLIKINDLKGQVKERIRIEKLRTDINNARQEVSPAKERIVELGGVLGSLKWVALEGQSTIRTLLGLATGKNNEATKNLLITELDNANNKRKETYKSFIMYFRKLAQKGRIEWSDVKKLFDLTKITVGGKEIEIDYNNLLSIYAHTQAEGNLRRLLKTKGLNIIIYFRDKNGIFNKKHIYRVGKPTLAELRTIAEIVPESHKKLLEIYFKANWDKQAPAINETSMAYQNFELAKQEKYFHVSREIERAIEGRKADISISIDQQSRGLPRTGGNARINIIPFANEVMANMQWSAAYHTMTIPMENARTLVANTKWREAMKRAGQHKVLKDLTTMLRRTQGLISDQSIIELTASRLLGTIGKSILSVRLSGSLVQTASVPAAIEFIDAKYLTQIDVPTPAEIKHLKDIDPVLWMRWEGKQFDYALGMVGAQNAFEKLLFAHTPITDKFLFPYTAGDEVAITKLFMAAQRKIEAETKLKKGTDKFQKASLDLLHEAMTSQPQWDMLHRSSLTSDPSVLARSITMFMSARNAQYNVLVRAIDDYRKGRIDKGQLSERLTGVGMANMFVSLARHTFKTAAKAGAIAFFVAVGIRKPPDEEEIKEEAKRLAKKIPLETAFNLIGLNALGTLFVSMAYTALRTRKYGWQASRYGDIRTGNMLADLTLDVMQTGIDFILFTDQVISGEKYISGKNAKRYKWEITGLKLIDDIALLIAYRFGLPYEGIKSDIVWPARAVLKKAEKGRGIEMPER